MARALDAGSGDAFTGRTSELRGKKTAPQSNRVGVKQVMHASTLNICWQADSRQPRRRLRAKTLTSRTCQKQLFLATSMTCSLAPSQRRTWHGKKTGIYLQIKINQTYIQTLELLFIFNILRVPLRIQQMWMKY